MCSMFTLGWIPIVFVLSTILGYFVPYFIATYTGHVYPFFPAISDSGIMEPESLVFREMMNISGFLAMTTTFIRYLQLRLVISSIHSRIPLQVQQLNFSAMIVGEIGGIAVTFVGNFSAKKVCKASLLKFNASDWWESHWNKVIICYKYLLSNFEFSNLLFMPLAPLMKVLAAFLSIFLRSKSVLRSNGRLSIGPSPWNQHTRMSQWSDRLKILFKEWRFLGF